MSGAVGGVVDDEAIEGAGEGGGPAEAFAESDADGEVGGVDSGAGDVGGVAGETLPGPGGGGAEHAEPDEPSCFHLMHDS
jgi:hypothetical protein